MGLEIMARLSFTRLRRVSVHPSIFDIVLGGKAIIKAIFLKAIDSDLH